MTPRSPFDPDTEFVLTRSDSPVTVDGVPLNAPTGTVRCAMCGREAVDIDCIPHTRECPQRYVRSRARCDLTRQHGSADKHIPR